MTYEWLGGPRRLRQMLKQGALANTLIIGTQKGGTTSLFHYLSQHPEVLPSSTKEVHFFDNAFDRGENWYRSHFVPHAGASVVVDASPYYMFHPVAAQRAAGVVPAAKVIVLLREPGSRAYSHYQHQVDKGRERLSFEDAIDAEQDRLANSEKMLADGTVSSDHNHQHFSYLARGYYAQQIERWLRYFPRENFLFLKAEDMFRDPQDVYERSCAFLGIARAALPDPEPRHQRSYGPMSGSTRQRLCDLFSQSNEAVAELTGIRW